MRGSDILRLVIVMLTAALIGCASPGTSRSLAPGDLAMLAGTWNGTVTPPSGGGGIMPSEGTLTLSPNGDYVFQVGAIVSRGAKIKGGALMLTSTSTSGGLTTSQRTSTATLSERPDGMLVLSGFGHSDRGPFNFEVTRKK